MKLCKCGAFAHPCFGNGYCCENCYAKRQTRSKSTRMSDKSPGGKRWVSHGERVQRIGVSEVDDSGPET